MEDCVIVATGRSAVGKAGKGALAAVNPVDFGAEVLAGVLRRVPQLTPADVEDVIVGCAIPEGKAGLNFGRNLVLRAGWPHQVPAQTVNRFCASGLQSIASGAAMIRGGLQEVVVAGGVESMSCPVISADPAYLDEWLVQQTDVYLPMGITAENVARQCGIDRARMEAYAVESHARATAAAADGWFDREIIPVSGLDATGAPIVFRHDECYRRSVDVNTLAALKPSFREDGLLTAATSSPRSDGAAFTVLMARSRAESAGIRPLARLVSFAVTGLDPALMGLGPVDAVRKALTQAGLRLNDLAVIELNEAFASQVLAVIDELRLNLALVNPHGGALALGHPLGATGAILVGRVIHELRDVGGRYGLVTMCVGGGMGAAAVIENLECQVD